MNDEEWGIQNLFETGERATRSGRKVRTPTYLRDYVQHLSVNSVLYCVIWD